MMKLLLLICISITTSSWTSAIDVPQQHVRRVVSDDADTNGREVFRSFAIQQLQQFDVAYTQLVQEQHQLKHSTEVCVPCFADNDKENNHGHRMLGLFSTIISTVRTTVQNISSTVTGTEDVVHDDASVDDFMTLLVQDSGSNDGGINRFFGGSSNSTMGGIFSSPIALLGGVALALVVILPLAILEAISLTTSVPILCILGFASSLLFGECRRRTLELDLDMPNLGNSTFFTKYFPNGNERLPTQSTNATADLLELLQIGRQPMIMKLLNQVTVSTFMTDLAANEETRPYVPIALIALTPILTLQEISERTNTPVRCILGNCRRNLQLSEMDQCEIDYARCQLKNNYMIME